MNKIFAVRWVISGETEVVAEDADMAAEILESTYTTEMLLENGKKIVWEIEGTTEDSFL